MGYFPSSAARWWDFLRFIAGGLLGWLLHPVIWVVAGPFRWIALLGMTAAQESGYNASAAGDNGDSIGIAQFNVGSWPELTGRSLEDRYSPFLSGYYSAKYVQLGLLASWSWWWQLAAPVYGAATMRYMWTHGISAYAAENAPAEAWSIYQAESKASGAFYTWRGLTILPGALLAVALYRFARRVAARKRRP